MCGCCKSIVKTSRLVTHIIVININASKVENVAVGYIRFY